MKTNHFFQSLITHRFSLDEINNAFNLALLIKPWIKILKLPSIMCLNWLNAKDDLDLISTKTSYFHWDLVDGCFAPDFTMGRA